MGSICCVAIEAAPPEPGEAEPTQVIDEPWERRSGDSMSRDSVARSATTLPIARRGE